MARFLRVFRVFGHAFQEISRHISWMFPGVGHEEKEDNVE